MCLIIKHHAKKAYWGNGGIAPGILNIGTSVTIQRAPLLFPNVGILYNVIFNKK